MTHSSEVFEPVAQPEAARLDMKLWAQRIGAAAGLAIAGNLLMATAAEARPYETTEIVNETAGLYRVGVDAPAPFKVTTSNVLGSQMPSGGNPKGRAQKLAKVFTGEAGATSTPSDVIGLQEVQKDQERYFKAALPGYQAVSARDPQNMILVNKETTNVLHSGTFNYSSYGDKGLHNGTTGIWAHVVDKRTGKEFTTLNLRMPAWNTDRGSDTGGAQKREHDAILVKRKSEELNKKFPGSTEVVLGDFNSTDDRRLKGQPQYNSPKPNKDRAIPSASHLPWFIMTKGGYLVNTFDAAQNNDKHVKNQLSKVYDWTVDQIHVEKTSAPNTQNIVSRWVLDHSMLVDQGSDHPVLSAEIDAQAPLTPYVPETPVTPAAPAAS